jgi:hypothetical protein
MGAVGCGSSTAVETTALHQPPRPLVSRPPEVIEIFSDGPPAEPHVDVALFAVERTREPDVQDADSMIWSVRQRAGEIGCDAVVLESPSLHVGADTNTARELAERDVDQLLASCIVYRQPVRPSQAPSRARPPL